MGLVRSISGLGGVYGFVGLIGAIFAPVTRRGCALAALALVLSASAKVWAGGEAMPTHPMMIDEWLNTLSATRVRLSPDGKWLLIVAKDQVPDSNPQTVHVYIKEARPGGDLKSLPPSAAEAVWRPDSRGLTVLVPRGSDCTQVWEIQVATRELVLQNEQCLEPRGSTYKRLQWSKDGQYLAVLVQPPVRDEVEAYTKRVTAGPAEQSPQQHCVDPASPEAKAMGMDALDRSCVGISVGPGWMIGLAVATPSLRFFWMNHSLPPPTELWVREGATGMMRRVSDVGEDVRRYDWSFSGHKLIWLTMATSKEEDPYVDRVVLGGQGSLHWMDVADTSAVAQSTAVGKLTPKDLIPGSDALLSGELFGAGFSWAPDERSLAISKEKSVWIYSTALDAKNIKPRQVFSGRSAQVQWFPGGGSLYVLSYRNGTQHLLAVDLQSGHIRRATDDERWHGEVSFSGDGRSFAFSLQDVTQPTRIYIGHEGSTGLVEVVGFRELNPAWLRITPLTYQRVYWRSWDHKYSFYGVVISSTERARTIPPMIVALLGANMPTILKLGLMDTQQPILVAAAEGNTVFIPNSRGRGDWGGGYDGLGALRTYFSLPCRDVAQGIDTVVAQHIADRKHIALMGVSFGGGEGGYYITKHRDIRAAALLEPVSMDIGGMWRDVWAQKHWGGEKWGKQYHINNPYGGRGKAFVDYESPLTYVNRVQTPTLLEFGVGSGTALNGGNAFYQALQWHHVDSALVMDPRTLHGITERSLLLASFRNRLDWLECHVSDGATQSQREHCSALSRGAQP